MIGLLEYCSRDRRYRDEERQPSRDTRRRSRSRDRNERERYRGGEREAKGSYRGPERERERGGGHDSRRRSASRSMSPSRSRSRGRAGGDEKRFARGASDRPKGSPRARCSFLMLSLDVVVTSLSSLYLLAILHCHEYERGSLLSVDLGILLQPKQRT